MKKQHLFTIDVDLIKRLHKKVPRGKRSQFVELAIKNKLNKEEDFYLEDVQTLPVILELSCRHDVPKSARVFLEHLYRELM